MKRLLALLLIPSLALAQPVGNGNLNSSKDSVSSVVTSSALPSGAATSALQTTLNGHVDGVETVLGTIDTDTGNIATSTSSIDGKITACNTGAVVVSSSALPSGAATAAKQPALGTAGTASTDVITVQGIASMTALKVDGSAVTQPVSGSVTVTDGSGALNVIVDSGACTVSQGTATSLKSQIFGDDTTQAIDTDAAGQLQVDVLTVPNVTIGTFPDNEPINIAQMNGVTVAMNAGANSTGTQRVTVATDDEMNDDLDAAAASLGVMDDWDNGASDGASVSGDVAHDSADAGEPVKLGAKAVASLVGQTPVAANDRSNLFSDLDGSLIVRSLTTAGDELQERISNTDGSSTALSTFGATASQKNVITDYSCINTSATGGYLDLRDGTGGSIIWSIPLPAGGGAEKSLTLPIRQPTANTALAYDVSGALTTVICSFKGFKSKQ